MSLFRWNKYPCSFLLVVVQLLLSLGNNKRQPSLLCCCDAQFLDQPVLSQSFDLNSAEQEVTSATAPFFEFLQGNSITTTATRLIATAADGSLHIVSLLSTTTTTTQQQQPPSILTYLPTPTQSSVLCQSGVAVYEASESGTTGWAVYAIGDASSSGTVSDSRVVAVDLVTAQEVWSVTVPGVAAGTPYLNHDQTRVYITHNYDNNGQITVIQVVPPTTGSSPYTALILETFPTTTTTSTLSGFVTPVMGRTYTDDSGVARDVVAFALAATTTLNDDDIPPASATQPLVASGGSVYVLVQTNTTTTDADPGYDLRLVSSADTLGAAIAVPPLLSSDATRLYVAQTAAADDGSFIDTAGKINGWDQSRDLTVLLNDDGSTDDQPVLPRWQYQLGTNTTTPVGTEVSSSPGDFLTAPVFSPDEALLFITSDAPELLCLNVNDAGDAQWVRSLTTPALAPPVVAQHPTTGEIVVYAIEAETGDLYQLDANDGLVRWKVDCYYLTGRFGCVDAVQAKFSLSPDGNILYYVTTQGMIRAVTVAAVIQYPSRYESSNTTNSTGSNGGTAVQEGTNGQQGGNNVAGVNVTAGESNGTSSKNSDGKVGDAQNVTSDSSTKENGVNNTAAAAEGEGGNHTNGTAAASDEGIVSIDFNAGTSASAATSSVTTEQSTKSCNNLKIILPSVFGGLAVVALIAVLLLRPKQQDASKKEGIVDGAGHSAEVDIYLKEVEDAMKSNGSVNGDMMIDAEAAQPNTPRTVASAGEDDHGDMRDDNEAAQPATLETVATAEAADDDGETIVDAHAAQPASPKTVAATARESDQPGNATEGEIELSEEGYEVESTDGEVVELGLPPKPAAQSILRNLTQTFHVLGRKAATIEDDDASGEGEEISSSTTGRGLHITGTFSKDEEEEPEIQDISNSA